MLLQPKGIGPHPPKKTIAVDAHRELLAMTLVSISRHHYHVFDKFGVIKFNPELVEKWLDSEEF